MRHFLRFAAALSIGVLTACGGGGGMAVTGPTTQPDPVTSATVQAAPSIQFTPATVTLAVGGTITFNFGSVPHNVYFDGAPAGAPDNITTPSANTTVTRTFNTKGRYAYNCHLHPGMSGVVVVQ